ncbi:MAG TPA: IS66 family transposase [Planktothrix sp.]
MSASRKILTAKQQFQIGPIRLRFKPLLEVRRLRAKQYELEKENNALKAERERLSAQLNLWRSEELDANAAEENHWRRRYALRNLEAEKLEGTLRLRETEIVALKQELQHKEALIKKLQKQLFERSSEQSPIEGGAKSEDPGAQSQDAKPPSGHGPSDAKPRGGQPGTSRSGPAHHDGLPIDECPTYDLDEACCAECGAQWSQVNTLESDEVCVQVRAYRRRHRRKKYGHFCKKKGHWVTKTAKGANRLFPHSTYGISFWVFLLVGRYGLHIAVNRLRLMLREHNLRVSQGTITAGFQRIANLIKPLIAELRRYSREDKHHWHIDDTGWKVFVTIDGKEGFSWYLWVFLSDNVCVYILSPSRARAIPKSHLENSSGVVTSDRLSANKKLGEFLVHSFCWVHERREFRIIAAAYPELFSICNHFLKLIGSVFHYNKHRLLNQPNSQQSVAYEAKLKTALEQIRSECTRELAKESLHPELRRVFKGILKDWDGLYLFFDLPAVPPDNNPAERALRGPVTSRKCSYGSGSEWSADFLADMYSLCETLRLNGLSAEKFLTEYLTACANNGGKPPRDAAKMLPGTSLRPTAKKNDSNRP